MAGSKSLANTASTLACAGMAESYLMLCLWRVLPESKAIPKANLYALIGEKELALDMLEKALASN